jgi:4-hydroxyproline epimerase
LIVSEAIRYIDSHTEGEATRVVLSGGPSLGSGPLTGRRARLAGQFDDFCASIILEPRGSDALVGALLCEAVDPSCAAGVIFFDNRVCLGMCGHGMIGLVVTLAHLGKLQPGRHRIETPVGVVEVQLFGTNEVVIENVPSYCLHSAITIEVPELGTVTGEVAWGGNWFFLTESSPYPLTVENITLLSEAAARIKRALRAECITGDDGSPIDHIEFFGPAVSPSAHSRNFVFCPGGAYDRSPCGTGTSAKIACLAAAGKLKPGDEWVQESIIGSSFRASYQNGEDGRILPSIRGRAFVCSEGKLIRHPNDPYRNGIQH